MGIVGKILGTTKSTGGAQGGAGVKPAPKKSKGKPLILDSKSKTKKN